MTETAQTTMFDAMQGKRSESNKTKKRCCEEMKDAEHQHQQQQHPCGYGGKHYGNEYSVPDSYMYNNHMSSVRSSCNELFLTIAGKYVPRQTVVNSAMPARWNIPIIGNTFCSTQVVRLQEGDVDARIITAVEALICKVTVDKTCQAVWFSPREDESVYMDREQTAAYVLSKRPDIAVATGAAAPGAAFDTQTEGGERNGGEEGDEAALSAALGLFKSSVSRTMRIDVLCKIAQKVKDLRSEAGNGSGNAVPLLTTRFCASIAQHMSSVRITFDGQRRRRYTIRASSGTGVFYSLQTAAQYLTLAEGEAASDSAAESVDNDESAMTAAAPAAASAGAATLTGGAEAEAEVEAEADAGIAPAFSIGPDT